MVESYHWYSLEVLKIGTSSSMFGYVYVNLKGLGFWYAVNCQNNSTQLRRGQAALLSFLDSLSQQIGWQAGFAQWTMLYNWSYGDMMGYCLVPIRSLHKTMLSSIPTGLLNGCSSWKKGLPMAGQPFWHSIRTDCQGITSLTTGRTGRQPRAEVPSITNRRHQKTS